MKLLKDYLKMRMPIIVLLAMSFSCFIITNWLYENPLNATFYAALLSMVCAIALGIVDFVKFKNFTKSLESLKNKIKVSIDGLPEPKDKITNDYTELLSLLWRAKQESDYEISYRYKDLVDYYTIWAHQIKTPIQAMRLILQTSEDDTNDLELELMRIEQYVDMVLTFLKLDSNSNDLVLRKTDVDKVIKAALKKNAKLFISKKISLSYEECEFEVVTDERWLQFAIEQILSNSLKYTNSGGTITIKKTSNQAIRITDTGIGIAKEDLPRVFERGFTGYNGRENKKATGIGLYLCHEVLNRMGHKISIDSEISKYTTVVIDFSRKEIDARD